jgi:hypothetical protein
MNKAWSESDIERLKSLAASGASALRASVALRRSLAMTRRKANELGFPFRTNCGRKALHAMFQKIPN